VVLSESDRSSQYGGMDRQDIETAQRTNRPVMRRKGRERGEEEERTLDVRLVRRGVKSD